MIPGSANPLLLASAAGAAEYQIERSLRFNSSDSAYLSRTPGSAGNRKTWTWAGWVKRSKLSTFTVLFEGAVDYTNQITRIIFDASDRLDVLFFASGVVGRKRSNAVFRDCSAWYHIVVAVDTTQATAANRIRVYVNGSEITAFYSTLNPTQNYDTYVNATVGHRINTETNSPGGFSDFYAADYYLIDGQALDPTSFGEFDDNGVWQPIEYAGTYGTNGFYLPFSDNSTAAALGTDTSGNSNTWTVNNISVTAGADNDSLVDSPTNGTQTDTGVGGEVVGNYATLNPLDKSSASTLTNGNLEAAASTAYRAARASIKLPSSGKWYAECQIGQFIDMVALLGPGYSIESGSYNETESYHFQIYNSTTSYAYYPTSGYTSYSGTFTSNSIIQIAVDCDTGKAWFGADGTWMNTGDPVAGTGEIFSSLPTATTGLSFAAAPYSTNPQKWNFGQRPFAYTAPSGYKALCTANLPTPTIEKGSDYFDTKLYTGNGSTQTISGLDFSPDFVWIKIRNGVYRHQLYDIVRGATQSLASDLTNAEFTVAGGVQSFDSDGFTNGNSVYVNQNGESYVAWTWNAGSSTVTNNDGSISSQVRANPSAGFSVVTFTMGSGSNTVGHGLNAVPGLVISKARSTTGNWWVFMDPTLGNDKHLSLNSTNAAATLARGTTTSSLLAVDNNFFANTFDYVAYCFAPVEGYSAFGSYTGNGSSDGPFVYTGFRPRWILTKVSSTGGYDWMIYDTERDTYNTADKFLVPNYAGAEQVESGGTTITTSDIDILSNGFKFRTTYLDINRSGETYIYAAFAEHPFQFSRAR